MKRGHDRDSETPDLKPLVLTAEQVAHVLGISVRSVWRFAGSGELPRPISIGRSKRWDVRAIEDYLNSKATENCADGHDLDRRDGYSSSAGAASRCRPDRSA